MIEYCQADREWFEQNVPYVPTNQQVMSMRLEDAIQHHDMVYLSDMGDTIVHDLAKLDAYCKAEMHHEQDLAKCQAIRLSKDDKQRISAEVQIANLQWRVKAFKWLFVVLCFAACLITYVVGRS